MNKILIGLIIIAIGFFTSGGELPNFPWLPFPVKKRLIDDPDPAVLIIEENQDRDELDPKQVSIFSSMAVREVVEKAEGHMAVIDEELEVNEPWATAKERPRDSVPWIIISGKTKGFEGPLPATVDETIELIKEYIE